MQKKAVLSNEVYHAGWQLHVSEVWKKLKFAKKTKSQNLFAPGGGERVAPHIRHQMLRAAVSVHNINLAIASASCGKNNKAAIGRPERVFITAAICGKLSDLRSGYIN